MGGGALGQRRGAAVPGDAVATGRLRAGLDARHSAGEPCRDGAWGLGVYFFLVCIPLDDGETRQRVARACKYPNKPVAGDA